MKKLHGLFLAAAALLASAGCEGPIGPTPPSVVFTAQLSSANEVPPVTNADAGATGSVTITLNNLTYDVNGRILAGTVDFAIAVQGFPLATTVSGAHIHMGAVGTSGAVLIDSGVSAEGGVLLLTGAGQINRGGIAATATALQMVVENPAGMYVNVHTTNSPNGAIRGQLVRQ